MKTYMIDFLPVLVKEARKLRAEGGAIIPLYSWADLEAESYYEAYNKVLEDLHQNTKFAKDFEKENNKPLGIGHIINYLEISVTDDKRHTKPKNGYIKPLGNELQERRKRGR